MNNTNLIQQLFVRLTSKSPKLFVWIQWISAIAALVVQIPTALAPFGINISIVDQPWKGIITVAGAVGFFVSKLPVSSDSTNVPQVNTK